LPVGSPVVGGRIDARLERLAIHQLLVGVTELVAGADVPRPLLAVRSSCSKVVREAVRVGGLGHLLGCRHRFERHHVVVDAQPKVRAGRLTIDQTMRLDGRLARVALAPNRDALLFGPFRRVLLGVLPEHVRVHALQVVVALKLFLDLQHELLGGWLRMLKMPTVISGSLMIPESSPRT
jgi:hypothetical protein